MNKGRFQTLLRSLVRPGIVFNLVFIAYVWAYELFLKQFILRIDLGGKETGAGNVILSLIIVAAVVAEYIGVIWQCRAIRHGRNHDAEEKKRFNTIIGLAFIVRLYGSFSIIIPIFYLLHMDWDSLIIRLVWLIITIVWLFKEIFLLSEIASIDKPYPEDIPIKKRFLAHLYIAFSGCVAYTAVWELTVLKFLMKGVPFNLGKPLEFLLFIVVGMLGAFFVVLPIRLPYFLMGLESERSSLDRWLNYATLAVMVVTAVMPLGRF